MRNTQTLLATLTKLVPPIAPARHGLTLEDDGLLCIHILQEKVGWRNFTLEPHDMDKNPEELANEVARLLKEPKFEEDVAPTVAVDSGPQAQEG